MYTGVCTFYIFWIMAPLHWPRRQCIASSLTKKKKKYEIKANNENRLAEDRSRGIWKIYHIVKKKLNSAVKKVEKKLLS